MKALPTAPLCLSSLPTLHHCCRVAATAPSHRHHHTAPSRRHIILSPLSRAATQPPSPLRRHRCHRHVITATTNVIVVDVTLLSLLVPLCHHHQYCLAASVTIAFPSPSSLTTVATAISLLLPQSSPVLRSGPMDRKKTATQPDRTDGQPDQRLRLHDFTTKPGCGCMFWRALLQPTKDRLRPNSHGVASESWSHGAASTPWARGAASMPWCCRVNAMVLRRCIDVVVSRHHVDATVLRRCVDAVVSRRCIRVRMSRRCVDTVVLRRHVGVVVSQGCVDAKVDVVALRRRVDATVVAGLCQRRIGVKAWCRRAVSMQWYCGAASMSWCYGTASMPWCRMAASPSGCHGAASEQRLVDSVVSHWQHRVGVVVSWGSIDAVVSRGSIDAMVSRHCVGVVVLRHHVDAGVSQRCINSVVPQRRINAVVSWRRIDAMFLRCRIGVVVPWHHGQIVAILAL
ncbi:hypothetical protein EDB85DRAFT_1903127 [Lactarius pseudohatsudake]|nr:hypothetical protein EDB85DRAFT_1903127 [Lactarius pseudohatsudake]